MFVTLFFAFYYIIALFCFALNFLFLGIQLLEMIKFQIFTETHKYVDLYYGTNFFNRGQFCKLLQRTHSKHYKVICHHGKQTPIKTD